MIYIVEKAKMNLKNYMFLLLFLMGNVMGIAQTIHKDYTSLYDLVENYYYLYYRYPKNIDDFFDFVDNSLKSDSSFYDNSYRDSVMLDMLSDIRKNSAKITIVEDSGFLIKTENDTLFYIADKHQIFSPCDISLFIGREPKEYQKFCSKYSFPRVYNKDGFVYSSYIDSLFQYGVRSLQRKYIKIAITPCYQFYVYEKDTVPIFTFLEYKRKSKLKYFCKEDKDLPRLAYYRKLEKYCSLFCKRYNLNRIIFMTPDYK
ncbi:hypothetical protein [Bacteroides sp.]